MESPCMLDVREKSVTKRYWPYYLGLNPPAHNISCSITTQQCLSSIYIDLIHVSYSRCRLSSFPCRSHLVILLYFYKVCYIRAFFFKVVNIFSPQNCTQCAASDLSCNFLVLPIRCLYVGADWVMCAFHSTCNPIESEP